jgi:predicted nucleic acid-binding protein
MILLDTAVIAEIVRPAPAAAVLEWLDARPPSELATTAISVAQIRCALARLGLGRRRADLETRFDNFISRGFPGRVFEFDAPAAAVYGDLAVTRERLGRPLAGFDGLIAAIARSRALAIATRDPRDFEDCGIEAISPWEA